MRRLRLRQPPGCGRVVELAIGGPLGRWFRRRDWGAFTVPLPFVQVIVYWFVYGQEIPAMLLRVHEWTHVEQNLRDRFWLASWCRYAVGLARVLRWRQLFRRPAAALEAAYRDHPAERDAYAVERYAAENGLPEWAREDA